jgi:uncharacterized protein YciI
MKKIFAVFRTRGPAWQESLPLESQVEWALHAEFMTNLHREGFAVFVGPLDGSNDVLLIARAESAQQIIARLAEDPWTPLELLKTTRIHRWLVRLGEMPA